MTSPQGRQAGRLEVDLRRERLSGPSAATLIAALNAELRGRYPNPVDCHFDLAEKEVAPGRGTFVVASVDGDDVGCGAVRMISKRLAEVKRMFVPGSRGHGIGTTILAFLESEARSLGATRIVAETGVRSPDALGTYRRADTQRSTGTVPTSNPSSASAWARSSVPSDAGTGLPTPTALAYKSPFGRPFELVEVRHASR